MTPRYVSPQSVSEELTCSTVTSVARPRGRTATMLSWGVVWKGVGGVVMLGAWGLRARIYKHARSVRACIRYLRMRERSVGLRSGYGAVLSMVISYIDTSRFRSAIIVPSVERARRTQSCQACA